MDQQEKAAHSRASLSALLTVYFYDGQNKETEMCGARSMHRRDSFKILVCKLERKLTHGRFKRRVENNSKRDRKTAYELDSSGSGQGKLGIVNIKTEQ
jgi:hypothetical protein